MIDRNAIEKALLIGIVKNKCWSSLILNNITRDYFTAENKDLYDYIKGNVDSDKYPDLRILGYEFGIDDTSMSEYTSIQDIDGLCDTLRKDFTKSKLELEMGRLNEHSQEILTNPYKYVSRIGELYDNMKLLGQHTKSVDLFADIDEILKIDPNDVISTGFKELDQALIGWKRGEELAVFMARTNQGKSWFGLKFAFAAALKGERVGIYSGEMSQRQLQERIINCAKQTYTSTKEDALKFIQEHDLCIRLLTQKELRRRANVNDIEEMVIREKLTMVVIDQLSLMEDVISKPGVPLRQQYGNITNDLLTMSSKHSLPVVLLVQSNRQGAEQRNGPALENIAEADAVGQNATRVLSMKNENGTVTINVVKNRYGPVGFSQKYDVDFGINKYKPIQEYIQPEGIATRKNRAREMFTGNSGRTF